MPLTLRDWYALNAVAGDTERYRRHSKLEAYYWGLQFDHLNYEWSDEEYPSGHARAGVAIPLRDKKPKQQYGLARRATKETVALLVGEGRYPSLYVDDDPDATQALAQLEAHVRLPQVAQTVARMVVVAGSAAIGLRAVRGERNLVADPLPGKWCTPTFGDDDPATAARYDLGPDDLTHLRVQYATPIEVQFGNGSTERRWLVFRRDYTPEAVIDYEKAEIKQDPIGNIIEIPELNESGRWTHRLGRVPAVWFRSEWVEGDVDGPGLYEHILDKLDDLDYGLSLYSDAVDYNVNPLRVFSGLANEHFSVVQAQLRTGKGNTLALPPSFGGEVPKLGFVEMSGTAVQAGAEKIKTLRAQALEVMRVVIQTHEDAPGAQSGVALDLLYRPMLSLIGEYRVTFGDGLKRVADLLLRAGNVMRGRLAVRDLPAYDYDEDWLAVDWPPVFPPTATDIQAEAQTSTMLVGGGLLSQETAIERTATRLSIADVEQEKKRIAKERAADVTPAVDDEDDSDGDE